MRGVRIPQGLSGEDQFVLGLSVPRLAALLIGLLGGYTVLHLALPGPVQAIAAAVSALTGAAIAWVRPEGRSLIHWAVAAAEFKVAERQRPTDSAVRLTSHEQRSDVYAVKDPAHPYLQVLPARTPVASQPLPVMPFDAIGSDDVIELPDGPEVPTDPAPTAPPADAGINAPVYLGGPQVITFFSTKGGTGRTTLATEVACLLAIKGYYRESVSASPQPLRVALIDFDLASANVSARLGLAQPTVLDYVCDSSLQTPDPRDFVVRHSSGVDVLLGPAKCLAGDRADLLGVAQAAHILSSFKAAGYHYLIVDTASSLGDLETYLLEAATHIYCVVTPTAASIQSLYRGVEALRRLGVAGKLHYVANKMRDGVKLDEVLGDLNGSLAASVPYDAAFDMAENRHQPLALQRAAAPVDSLTQLAASIYPALQTRATVRTSLLSFGWFSRRRRAG
jgi:MinD-like ATPase involved in chromosome partitioning or flagellar assembly